tara:strand:+ start:36338 stop:36697 length:360 start_codon:yes stop_codon:yes gene_type:complete
MSALDIAKWAKKVNADLGSAVLAIKMELFSGVILATRVDTGRMRGNWQTQTGEGIYQEITRKDKEGGRPIAEAAARVTVNGVDYLTNNVPYAAVWNEQDAIIDGQIARVENNIARLIKT